MNTIQKSLLQLLTDSIRGKINTQIDLKEEEWEQLFYEAKAHEVHLIIYNTYTHLVRGKVSEFPIKDNWKRINLLTQLCLQARLSIFKQVLIAFKSKNIQVLILKGLYIRTLYFDIRTRTMGDVDLLIKKEDLEKAIQVLIGFGYTKNSQDNSMHVNLSHEMYINIELHYAASRSDILSLAYEFNKEIWNNSKEVKLFDIDCLVPSDMNHLIFCCLHMANHFKYCGFGLRQLCDLVILMESVKDEFPWYEFLNRVRAYGIGTFTEAILVICNKYLSLNIPANVLNELSNSHIYIPILMEEILLSGVFGLKSKVRVSNNSLANYLMNEKEEKRKLSILRYIFPPRSKLCDTYAYAKNHFVLTPVAWGHRIIQNIFRTDLRLSEKKPDIKHIEKHIKLVKWLSIK